MGRSGDDIMRGGPGRDRLDGGPGNDRLVGGEGKDMLVGGDGDDIVVSGTYFDLSIGPGGYDRVDLGPGNDQLYRNGFDSVDCGPGIDTIHVPANSVSLPTPIPIANYRPPLIGDIRNCELIVTDNTSDPLDPAAEMTIAWTNAGRTTGVGSGRPRGSLAAADDERVVARGTARDDYFDPTLPSTTITTHFKVRLPPGNVTGLLVLGRGGNDILIGRPDSDHLEGEAGNDTLRGRAGNDLLHGRTGNDILTGDDGDDELQGGRGRDVLDGGPGNDRMTGGFDADQFSGGPAHDRIVAVDGERDRIDCGPGQDTALVDRIDRVRNCEHVRRGSSTP